MTLPPVELDDLRFQDLVNECRTRVAELCPEWNEVNVSDPGITLIELFAWMTDQLSYRINRIPEKLHVALLGLLDVHLYPPHPAKTELRIMLEHTVAAPLHIPAWRTEASTPRTPGREPVVFAVSEDFTLRPAALDAYLLQRAGAIDPVTVRDHEGVPAGPEMLAFDIVPKEGDCMLFGFGERLDRMLLRIDVTCTPARGIGVVPSKPPLLWQACVGETLAGGADWRDVELLRDTTQGFNAGTGEIVLAMPERLAHHTIRSHRYHWVRCVLHAKDANSPLYEEPPVISRVSAHSIGATLPAQHAQRVENEVLGRSDGTPGQILRLRRAPILDLAEDERLEVLDADGSVPWKQVETFADSGQDDRHFKLDAAAGEIEFGPVVRQVDGSFRRYGAIPPTGAEIRLTAYRHGGGTIGNVAADTVTHLRRPIPGVRTVTNPKPATQGVDGETIASAQARMAIELRTRHRAITAEDFEQICLLVPSRRVARAHCFITGPDGHVRVVIVPKLEDPIAPLAPDQLMPNDDLLAELKGHLDERRLIGMTVEASWPRYQVVTVAVSVVQTPRVSPAVVEARIKRRLYTYLNPLVGGRIDGPGPGWELGRTLSRAEIERAVRAVDGVDDIRMLRVYRTDVGTGLEEPAPLGGDLPLAWNELIVSGVHSVRVEAATQP